MNAKLSINFIEKLEVLQDVLIEHNDQEGIYGDGKTLVNNEEFPITNNFSDGLYMRQMKMKASWDHKLWSQDQRNMVEEDICRMFLQNKE